MDYEKYKEICNKNKTWCPKCPLQIKNGYTKGLCGARDKNGLTPNQWGYGDKF
jgi:hypothetical protein